MSAVALRCPNCGTTQGTEGECDTCHEADVRYFCGNHTPGRWLDGPRCNACGAEVGRDPVAPPPPRRTPPSSPPPRRPSRTAPPDLGRPSAPTPASAPPPPPPRRRPITDPRLRRVEEMRTIEDAARRERASTGRGTGGVWEAGEILEEMRRGRRETPTTTPPVAVPPRPVPPRRAPRLPIAGCLVRLALAAVLLVALGIGALFLVMGSGGVSGWVTDVGQSVGVAGGVPAQTQRGIDAYRAGDYATAERELSVAADAYPSSALALLYLARIRASAGDLDRAGEYLEEAVRREPASSIAHRELAAHWATRARALRGQPASEALASQAYQTALHEYDRAYELDPSDQRSVVGYGCTLAEMGETNAAEQMLARVGRSAATCR